MAAAKSSSSSGISMLVKCLSFSSILLLTKKYINNVVRLGRGGGLVVSTLAYCSQDPSLNPADFLTFLYEKTKVNKKEAGVGTF